MELNNKEILKELKLRAQIKQERYCPKCKKWYSEPPALSRVDNETMICPECGIRETNGE